MADRHSPVTEIFNRIAETRTGHGLRHKKFEPLSPSQVRELQASIRTALESAAQPLQKPLRRALDDIAVYEEMATHVRRELFKSTIGSRDIGLEIRPNPERAETLKKMQHRLYKALK